MFVRLSSTNAKLIYVIYYYLLTVHHQCTSSIRIHVEATRDDKLTTARLMITIIIMKNGPHGFTEKK